MSALLTSSAYSDSVLLIPAPLGKSIFESRVNHLIELCSFYPFLKVQKSRRYLPLSLSPFFSLHHLCDFSIAFLTQLLQSFRCGKRIYVLESLRRSTSVQNSLYIPNHLVLFITFALICHLAAECLAMFPGSELNTQNWNDARRIGFPFLGNILLLYSIPTLSSTNHQVYTSFVHPSETLFPLFSYSIS